LEFELGIDLHLDVGLLGTGAVFGVVFGGSGGGRINAIEPSDDTRT
jgi:hypothetical protein